MDLTRTLYLLLTVIALAFPVRRFVTWFMEHGFDLPKLAQEVTATDPMRAVTFTVILLTCGALIFMVSEASTRRDWFSLICVPVTLIFGVAVGLPLYLYLRLRPLT